MPATMTTVAGILKEVYEGDVTDQLQENAVLAKRIEKSSDGVFEDAGGKYVRFPIRTQRNHGISYRAESGQLAAAGQQGYLQAQETLKYGYGRVRLSGQVMGLADSNPKAFVNAADEEIDGLKSDVSRDVNRIMWGHAAGFVATSNTGVISRSTASSAASTTVTAPLNNVIEVGMVIDITDNAGASGGTNCLARTVTAVAANEASFTVDLAVTFTSPCNIMRTGNFGTEPYGLTALVSQTGTIHGINSATAGNETWRAAEDDSTTTTLTETAMISKCHSMRRKGGDMPTAVFCSLGVQRTYFNLLTSMRRYNEPKQWTGGLVGLAFNMGKEIPVVEDIDCPSNSMYFINEQRLSIYRNRPWYFDDTDGAMFKYIHDYDLWEALYKCYWQFVIHKRNAAARFTAIVEA